MQNRFSIGEMSRLMNVPIKTLRYYDEIGLFKPVEVNRDTGYRYYSTEQFEQLDIIKYLRLLGVPLAEIAAHFTQLRVENFLQLLKRQEKTIDEKIRELQQTRQKFGSRIAELEQALQGTEVGIPVIKRYPARRIIRLQASVRRGPGLEMMIRKLEKLIGGTHSPIFIGKVGFTVSADNLLQENFQEYSSVFILMEESMAESSLSAILPAGEYACLLFQGSHNDSTEPYRQLLSFVARQGRRLHGEAVERAIVDEFISGDSNRYLTEIQLPVRKRRT
jgi:DNA-binding transcriptional MerR regulator/effector-binding domain-containing protein